MSCRVTKGDPWSRLTFAGLGAVSLDGTLPLPRPRPPLRKDFSVEREVRLGTR